ncbi:MAG: ribose 5-phosphate isomerase B, partial [Proteobacteria bacterium]|nr:ribose 5-phosphate isomerase B [Pseudomonadota bacterium]
MILIASDHGGYELKEDLTAFLGDLGVEARDLGPGNGEPVDYPEVGLDVASRVGRREAERGILLCGTGIGMSIVANKIPGVRAALVHDVYSARMAREHNDANVLVIGGRTTGKGLAREIVRTWLGSSFEGGRHARRLQRIAEIEGGRAAADPIPALQAADPEVWAAVQG